MKSNSKQTVLSGDVAYIRIIINVSREIEDEAWTWMVKIMPEIRSEAEELTNREFGSQLIVRSMTPIRGSIEVMVVIGATYYAVASYEDFLGGVERIRSQVQRLCSNRMERFNPTVTSTTTLGPSAANVPTTPTAVIDPTKMILLGYIILSHAALLVLFIWMLSKKLG